MRPLHLTYVTHYAQLYGANRSLLDMALALRRSGAVVPHVLLPEKGPLTDNLTKEGVPFAVVPFAPWMSTRHYEGRPHHRLDQYFRYTRQAREHVTRNRAAIPAILERLRSWGTDIVHINSLAVGVGEGLVRSSSVPVVWHVREMPERHYGMYLEAGRRRYGRVLSSASRIVAISEAARQDVKRYIRADKEVVVVPNGVFTLADHDSWEAELQGRWDARGSFNFLIAGVIHPGKGQEEAIRAMAIVGHRYPEARLWIAGAGNTGAIRRIIDSLDLGSKVALLGHRDDMNELYRDTHALLMCSHSEAFGRVTVEAMAHGIPVIGRAEGGTLEVLDQGRMGLLYSNGPEELADRMALVLADRAEAQATGTRGREHVRTLYNIERCADTMLGIYRSSLSSPS